MRLCRKTYCILPHISCDDIIVQRREISVPREMQRGAFPKHIAAFQLVGYSAWNGEATGSSPVCYTCIGSLV